MLDDITAYIDQMIAGFYIKYIRLNEIINQSYYSSNATELNLFIDLNSVIKPMFLSQYKVYRHRGPYDIVSSMINMCGHYREFFNNKGVSTRIFIVMGLNAPITNSEMIPEYNRSLLNAYMLKKDTYAYLTQNLSMLNLLCEYIPGVYYIDGGNCETSSVISHIIRALHLQDNDTRTSIVLSKDELPLQLIPLYGLRVLRPYKSKEDGDLSYIVDWNNLFETYIKIYRKLKMPSLNPGPCLISNIMAMTSVPMRNLSSVHNINQVMKIIKLGYEYKFIKYNELYSQSSINTILDALGVKHNNAALELRWKAINPEFQAMFVLPNEGPYLKRLRLVDLNEPDEFRRIIDKYFNTTGLNPIDLDRL